jgi:PAS domain S-box-containing protein
MDERDKTNEQLRDELTTLRHQLAEQTDKHVHCLRVQHALATRLRLSEYALTHTLEQLLQKTLDEAEALTDSQIGFFHFVEADQITLWLQMWSTNTLRKMCTANTKGAHYPITQAGVWVDCVHQRRPVIHNDYASLTHRKGMPEGHAPVHKELVVPVFQGERIVAILGVGNKLEAYDDTDIETVTQLATMAWDIVARKKIEDTLRENERMLNQSHEIAGMGSFVWDLRDDSLRWSRNMYVIHGLDQATFAGNLNEVSNWTIHPDDQSRVRAKIAQMVAERKMQPLEYRIIRMDGAQRMIRSDGYFEFDETGRPIICYGIHTDVTERRQAEDDLRKSDARLREAQHLAHIGSWEWALDQQTLTWSDEVYRIFGLKPGCFMPTAEAFEAKIHPDDREDFLRQRAQMLAEKQSACIDHRIVLPNGEVRNVQERAELVMDEYGQVTRVIGTVQDITERKQAEETIRAALAEKEVLLRELYHRTKNNMQVIQGMLALQADHLPDAAARQVLSDVADKIQSMALVHQMLYQSQNLSQIDLKTYIENLVKLLDQPRNTHHHLVRFTLELESLLVPIEVAIPCGLILNELISNVFKHAFPGDTDGTVSIRTKREADGCLLMEVSDNGVGFPASFDFHQAQTLGLQTVVALVEHQLQGQVTYITHPGVTCQVRLGT